MPTDLPLAYTPSRKRPGERRFDTFLTLIWPPVAAFLLTTTVCAYGQHSFHDAKNRLNSQMNSAACDEIISCGAPRSSGGRHLTRHIHF
jgi:hypothetical protein